MSTRSGRRSGWFYLLRTTGSESPIHASGSKASHSSAPFRHCCVSGGNLTPGHTKAGEYLETEMNPSEWSGFRQVFSHFGCFDAAVGEGHGCCASMQKLHAHQSKAGRSIGNSLGISANARHHVQKCLNIVTDGFKARDFRACKFWMVGQT